MKSPPPRRGFTLIELLVVVVVIGILIALVFPLTAKALGMGQHTVCVANLRNICQATVAYAFDREGALPAPGWYPDRSAQNWLHAAGNLSEPEHVKTGQLWPLLESMDTYRCPKDTPPDQAAWDRIEAIIHRNSYKLSSYCANGATIAYGRGRTGYTPDFDSQGNQNTIPIDLFTGDSVLYWEADEWYLSAGMWWDAANYPWEGMSGRHGTWGSFGCVDGHVEKFPKEKYYALSPWGAGPNQLWCVPSVFSSNGQ